MDYYILMTPEGEMLFEGTLAQADDCFGIHQDCEEGHLLAFAEQQGWWMFQRVVSQEYAEKHPEIATPTASDIVVGSKVMFQDHNGRDHDRETIKALGVTQGAILTIKAVEVEDWNTEYQFEEIDGWHNSVMFVEAKNN